MISTIRFLLQYERIALLQAHALADTYHFNFPLQYFRFDVNTAIQPPSARPAADADRRTLSPATRDFPLTRIEPPGEEDVCDEHKDERAGVLLDQLFTRLPPIEYAPERLCQGLVTMPNDAAESQALTALRSISSSTKVSTFRHGTVGKLHTKLPSL